MVEGYPQAMLYADNEEKYAPIHVAAANAGIKNLYEILSYLIVSEPTCLHLMTRCNETPLQIACGMNKCLTLETVQLLVNAWPESIRQRGSYGNLPLHDLCRNKDLDESASVEVLQFMLKVDPTLPRRMNDDDYFPIHDAVCHKSTNFCKVLIDAWPESLSFEHNGYLPIHEACSCGNRFDTVETIEYMLKMYPESVRARRWSGLRDVCYGDGYLPIHYAAECGRTETIKLLLMHDHDAAKRKVQYMPGVRPRSTTAIDVEGALPLHLAAYSGKVESTHMLFDAYPEGIFVGTTMRDSVIAISRKHHMYKWRTSEATAIISFLNTQLAYAQMAQGLTFMSTTDETGRLPLHNSLVGGASLGSVKLFTKGNPSAFVADQNGALPLHLACEFSSVKVVKFLLKLGKDSLGASSNVVSCANCGNGEGSDLKACTACKLVKYCNVTCQKAHRSQHKKACKKRAAEIQIEALFELPPREEYSNIRNRCDLNKDSLLHYACRAGNCEVVQYLLESHAPLVASTTVNADNKLPIHLLCEAGKSKVDCESPAYIETIWRLLLADPEVLVA